LLAVFALLVSPPTVAVDYQNIGSLTAEAGWVWDIDDASYYSYLLTNKMTHSLELDSARITARSLVALPATEEALVFGGGGLGHGSRYAVGDAEIRIPEASLALYPADWVTVRAGWFDLDWGTGYVFDPGNVLGSTAANELAGRAESGPAAISGFLLTFVPSYQLTIGAAASLFPSPALTRDEDPWRDTAWAVWASGYAGSVDLFAGLQASPERFLRPSLGVSSDVAGVIVGAEAAVELEEPFLYPGPSGTFERRKRPQLLATGFASWQYSGANATFGATGEYLYAGLGYDPSEAERLYDAIEAIGGASGLAPGGSDLTTGDFSLPFSADGLGAPPLGQHYLISQMSFSWSDAVELSGGTLLNLTDWSHLINGRFALVTISAVDLFVEGTCVGGDEGQAEYSLAGSILLLRIGAKVVW